MRLKNSLVHVRDIGALIATPARPYLAIRGSKPAEIEARKGEVAPTQQGYQRTNLHNKLRRFRNEMPEDCAFKGHRVRRIPFRGNPG
jgi:hypothetical protein